MLIFTLVGTFFFVFSFNLVIKLLEISGGLKLTQNLVLILDMFLLFSNMIVRWVDVLYYK